MLQLPFSDTLEQLLASTWSDTDAAAIADRVTGPGSRGDVVRAVQPDAPDRLVLFLHHQIADELQRHTGVDLDHATDVASWQAVDQVLAVLVERWADGGDLPAVADTDRDEAEQLLAALTMKAAEWAGCDIVGDPPDHDPWIPLVIDGRLLVDVQGLALYLDTYRRHPGIDPAERRAIHRLQELARSGQ